MNRDEFNNLSAIDQVEYINNLLENKKTLTNIAKDLKIGRSTISDRFKKLGYRYNKQLNKYIESNDIKSNTDVNSRMINIINEYETLMQMIELYKSNSNVLQSQIIIDLPEANSELTSFRVNKEILKQFNEFVKEQKEFRKIDLVSMALKEYIENHGK